MLCSTLGQKLLHINAECSRRYNHSQRRKWNLGTLKHITCLWSQLSVLVFYSLIPVRTSLYLSYAAPPPYFFFCHGATNLVRQGFLIVEDSWSHSGRHTALGRTPLDEWTAWRTDLYLTTHNTYKWLSSMPPAGFDPAIPASERLQTHALDRSAAGISPLSTGMSKY